MSIRCMWKFAGLLAVALTATTASAQMPNPYGASINPDNAKKVAAATLAEAKRNGWTQAAAIVDTAGELVYFEKLDGTQFASNDIAIDKARASVRFKRPTKALQDALAAGGEGWRFLTLRGVVAAEGGVPLLMDGKIVGALGVSGGTGAQDGQAANAGIAALK
jgi:glc operon protein GlcG